MGRTGLRDVINRIEQKYIKYNQVLISGSSFTDHSCTIKFDNMNDYIALKAELLCKNSDSMCDCIIYKANEGMIIGVVELKNETKARKAMNQLANGSKLALNILQEFCNGKPKRKFYIILLHNGGWHPSELKKISKGIEIEGKKYNINIQRCGYSFNKAITGK